MLWVRSWGLAPRAGAGSAREKFRGVLWVGERDGVGIGGYALHGSRRSRSGDWTSDRAGNTRPRGRSSIRGKMSRKTRPNWGRAIRGGYRRGAAVVLSQSRSILGSRIRVGIGRGGAGALNGSRWSCSGVWWSIGADSDDRRGR
jgi:hypothetical protein